MTYLLELEAGHGCRNALHGGGDVVLLAVEEERLHDPVPLKQLKPEVDVGPGPEKAGQHKEGVLGQVGGEVAGRHRHVALHQVRGGGGHSGREGAAGGRRVEGAGGGRHQEEEEEVGGGHCCTLV